MPKPRPSPETIAKLDALLAALDLSVLGEVYCDEGGEAFWQAQLPAVRELGLAWAAALGTRLEPGGRSLYVGAGVAELPVLLFERRELGRDLVVCNLSVAECESLNASLDACSLDAGLRFEAVDAAEAMGGPFDHLSVLSVFSDPVHYPLCSAVSYGRMPPVALDLEAFESERQQLRGLAAGLCAQVDQGTLCSTSGEDLPWLLAAAAARGLSLEPEDAAELPTAVVGDPLGFARFVRA